ncbi:MAG: TIGR02099 family protein [Gammaproteobacteria bacterium]|nr:TIGR02099 family protein [Gammaproteobacteria bacterium]
MEGLKRLGLAVFVSAVILLALIMGGMRLVISNIDFFKPEIGYLLERDVSKGIVFNRVSGSMNRFNPVLLIENVSLNLPDRSQPLFIDRLEVEFDFWSSLRNRAPVVLEVSGKLEKLELIRDVSGLWWLNEYQIGSGEAVMPGFSQFLELLPRYLQLDLRRLIIRDETHQETHQLSGLSARINHRKGKFFTQLSVGLPAEFGRSLLLKSVIDPTSSLIYLNSSDLQLSPVARLFGIDTRGLKSGGLDGEVWLDMSEYRITAVKGDLLLRQGILQVTADKSPLSIDYHAKFNSAAGKRHWRVSSKIDGLVIDGDKVPGFAAQVDIPVAAGTDKLSAWIDRLPISSLPVVAGQWLPNTLDKQISDGRLQGLMRNVLFEINFDQAETFRLAASIEGLSSQRSAHVPGVTNLNADLVMGNNRLAATLYGEGVSLDFGDQFRGPLEADSISMQATLDRQPSGNLLLAVDDIRLRNPDLSAIGRLRLETDGDNAPFMYLRASFSDAIASRTGKYLPVKLMSAKITEWLDRGIIGGFVPAGDLQFHGRLRDIRKLARERAVEFFVDFGVRNAEIFFAPGWLHAKNGTGRILFHNVGVEFDLEQASFDNIHGLKVQGGIANFQQASLDLAIQADAATGDAVRVWRDTPVGARFRDVLDRLQDFNGEVSCAIDIRLPLGSGQDERKVSVEVDLQNSAARVPGWGLDLSQITGRIKVTDASVAASNISARFFGDPVTIDIDSDGPGVNTRVAVQGNLASANLLRRMPPYLAEAVSGNSDWQLHLDIAGDAAPPGSPYLQIKAASDLKDTSVAMPLPFNINAAEAISISTEVNFYPQQIRFSSKLGANILGRGSLASIDDGEFRLEALEIAFFSELAAAQTAGINLHGQLAELNIDDWLAFLSGGGADDPALLRSVRLSVDRALAFGQKMEFLVFELQQVEQRFTGVVDASIVQGRFDFPLEISAQDPLKIDLDFLDIKKLDQESEQTFKPSSLPAVRLASKSVRYADMLSSDLLFEASPTGEILKVTGFSLRHDALQLKGSGQWQYDPLTHRHLSSAKVNLKGSQLGESMAKLGFGNSMSGGKMEFNGDFSWPAPFFDFNLDTLAGEARMKITDGVMNNVEPGSGRFVGLLSLTALPRRLGLDFSDVLIGGMAFDEITGSYRIGAGILYTKDTRVDGPAARIKISGKTGIITRDYDQVIRIVPKIRQTLPLIGAVAASTTVGWGLLLLQNLFKTAIDDAVEVEYHVTGSWDDPEIELIKAVDEKQRALPKIDK